MTKKRKPEYEDLSPNTLGCLGLFSVFGLLLFVACGLLLRLFGG